MEISMDYDVIIIGAGPAGLSFARSLANSKLRLLLIERAPLATIEQPAEDGREIALTHLSVKLMKQLGAWQRIDPESISPIKTAKVINGNSSYSLDFTRPSKSLEALGYLIPNHLIRKAFYDEVATFKNITLLTDTSVTDLTTDESSGNITLSTGKILTASLIIAADSRFSETRRKMGISTSMHDFSRTAIVCRMKHELSHQQTAFECFHYGKTMALLPMTGNLSSVVITISNKKVGAILKMSDDEFNQQVQQWFGKRLGKISLVGKRHSYPLIAVHADKFISNRYAVIGDASVGMHPVTAHGFNLGLRGANTLAGEIAKAHARGRPIASASVLKKYERKHMYVTKFLYHGTNHIVGLFTNETRPAKILRTTALRIANNFPPIRHLITAKLTETGKAAFLPPLPPLPFPLPFKKTSNKALKSTNLTPKPLHKI
jgi:ubiquinone biosynthesis UbiH/UbiF/VisC/COQ6 family hydroxylase